MSGNGRENGNNQDSSDPFVTYLEGEKVRILHYQKFDGIDENGFYLFRRRNGQTIKIQKPFIIKIEETPETYYYQNLKRRNCNG